MSLTLDEILLSHHAGRSAVMGILNVTPDSFSDGGRFFTPAEALAQARRMVAEGAAVLDVGAESTRPGSARVPAGEQIDRLRPILAELVGLGAIVSVDTTRAAVAEFALDVGAAIINDVSAGRDDPDLLPLVARRGAAVVLMHMLGEPATMQKNPVYRDVVAEVRDFLAERLAAAEKAGVPRERCIVDPGIGFGKRMEHNLALLAGIGRLQAVPGRAHGSAGPGRPGRRHDRRLPGVLARRSDDLPRPRRGAGGPGAGGGEGSARRGEKIGTYPIFRRGKWGTSLFSPAGDDPLSMNWSRIPQRERRLARP
jgi:dihydropteroate synthase